MRLLIVGTLNGHIGAAGKIAIDKGAKVAHIDTVDGAIAALRAGRGADLVMVDVTLDIKSFCDQIAAERIHIPVVACGIGTDASSAVRAIRAGAKEYIPLPPDAELIAAVLAAVTEDSHTLVSRDPAMTRLLEMAQRIAPSDASVLVTGESGSGKELVARHVHKNSKRADQQFIAVNCAAIPENLLESELFGHEKGAFTGAVARRVGKFEEANGGTLLLDEISEMHPRLQAKLLRAIQEREIDRVGGTQPVKVDVRILATSNRNLEDEVRQGNFREDLFFRLNVVNLVVPSLRDRPDDIPLLAEHFARKYADANGLGQRTVGQDAMTLLRTHTWRGNVRELENTMHRAVLLASEEEIGPDAIMLTSKMAETGESAMPGSVSSAALSGVSSSVSSGASEAAHAAGASGQAGSTSHVGQTVAEVERLLILDTLKHTLGNRTHAANILGISIRTLRNKLKQYSEEGTAVTPPGDLERVIG